MGNTFVCCLADMHKEIEPKLDTRMYNHADRSTDRLETPVNIHSLFIKKLDLTYCSTYLGLVRKMPQ